MLGFPSGICMGNCAADQVNPFLDLRDGSHVQDRRWGAQLTGSHADGSGGSGREVSSRASVGEIPTIRSRCWV